MKEIISSLEILFIKGIGNATFKKLISFYKTSENILNSDFNNLKENFGEKIANLIVKRDKSLREKALKEYEKAIKHNVKIIPFTSEIYPEILKEIPDPPIVLYVKGNLKELDSSISVVGTRKPSNYGIFVVNSIVKEMVSSGITIVSGLASGIDTLAHKITLKEKGYTVAVLGSSIDIVYPYENKKLYDEISEKGCVVSEFPFETKPSSYTFPQRNRIIAGLSYGTFVVEAPVNSGSLITASYANDYGRLVFTVPANINLDSATGNNLLIKEGAIPITKFDDFKQHLPFFNFKEKSVPKDNIDLTQEERFILQVIGNEKVFIDRIIEAVEGRFDVYRVLNEMVLKGLLSEEFGFYYVASDI